MIKLADLFIHEYEHNLGYRHDKTTDYVDLCNEIMEAGFTNGYIVREKEVKPKQDKQLIKYDNVVRMIEKKKRMLRRIQNQLKKWNTKKRYYEKILIACNKIKKEE